MIAKIFLAVLGATYLALAAWCAVDPAGTSCALGLERANGGGRSEYLTIYGGLQAGLGVLFLWPMLRSGEYLTPVLLTCVVIHAGIVVFRTLGFALYSDIPGMTKGFAVGEWVILLVSGYLYWKGDAT
ncbi:MAG: hypothetical protein QM811_14540 [Pirellulales bacterium]